MKQIVFAGGAQVLIDDSDFAQVSRYKWSIHRSHRETKYVTAWIQGRKLTMHRYLMQTAGSRQIDHRNGNGLDNRRANLRACSHRQNQMNAQKRVGTKSKYKGVTFYPHRRERQWRATITIKGRNKHLGYFNDEAEAGRAYNSAARIHFGEWARGNDIPPNKPCDTEGTRLTLLGRRDTDVSCSN